jgi:hypothetical protein
MKQRRTVQIRLSRTPASPRRGRRAGLPMRRERPPECRVRFGRRPTGANRPGDIGSPRRRCVCRQLTRSPLSIIPFKEEVHEQIDRSRFPGRRADGSWCRQRRWRHWRRHRAPISSKSPADAAPAGIADPMADAGATTPIRRRIPARADGISDDTAVAAPTGHRDFDHLRADRKCSEHSQCSLTT